MTTNQIRDQYLAFMAQNGHTLIPRANLVPQDDPTTLFTGSGMQPLIPYLLGAEHPGGRRIVNSQTCFRAEDIDEVGDNRHTTYFEMLGNWSLGDYFKKEQLQWYWEFITSELGIDPSRLYVTVFIGDESIGIAKDSESAQLWRGLFKDKGVEAGEAIIGSAEDGYARGIKPGEHIFYYDAKENWWSRAGVPRNMPAGEPGGPDSEVFYEFTEIEHDQSFGENCHPACDCGRFLEIGNNVFMAYRKQADGSFQDLPQKNVDFGGGLERIAAAAQNTPDIYKIDSIWPIIQCVESLSQKQYEFNRIAMRIIADHLRVAVWLAVDGVRPSNVAQGYVMRRFIRRAVRQGLRLGITQNLCSVVAGVVIEQYTATFAEVKAASSEVIEVLDKEEQLFRTTLERGVREFEKMTGPTGKIAMNPHNFALSGHIMFRLFDTYGFPPELSLEEAEHLKIKVDQDWRRDFDNQMKEQKDRSRSATAGTFKGGLADQSDDTLKLHTVTHLMYQALREVLGDHVVQRGSNITPERLRFDFSHDAKLTDEQKTAIETIVNQQIKNDLKVWFEEHPTKEAFKLGAKGAFGDKYGDVVKVYFMAKEGQKPFSVEICGGPHVTHTGVLGTFKIQKEESSSSGVRRIKAKLS